jgi:hypothetical protein
MFTFATAVSQFYIRFHIVISFAASSPSWHLARLLLACAATKSCWNFLIERKGYCEEALRLSHFLPCIVSKMQSGDHIFYIITMLAKFMEGLILWEYFWRVH